MTEPTAIIEHDYGARRRRELLIFAVLAFVLWPILAVGVVGGYGFLVWGYQMIYGPPGPHEITPARPNSAEE